MWLEGSHVHFVLGNGFSLGQAKALRDVAEGFSTDGDEDQEGEDASNANQEDRDERAQVANGEKVKSRRVSWLAEGKMDYFEGPESEDADADGDEELEMEEEDEDYVSILSVNTVWYPAQGHF